MNSTTTYNSKLVNNEGGGQTTVYTPNPPTNTPTAVTPPVTPVQAPQTPVAPPTAPVVDPSKPLNASSIQGTTPTSYPPAVTTNTTTTNNQLGATVGGQANSAGLSVTQAAEQQNQPAPTPSTPRQSALDNILGIFKQEQNQGADTAAANKENDVAGKQQKVTDLTNQLASTSASWDAQIQSAQKNLGGGGQAGVDAQVAQLTQQKNQDLANISIQLNAANGNYTTAAAIAKQTVDAKYAPLKDELATLQQYYQLSSNDLTDSEKQQAQAAIAAKQAEIDHGYSKDLAAYNEQLQQSDPLHQAQIAEAWANVTKTKAETSQLGSPSGSGDFGATVNLAANTGSTNQQRTAISNNLKELIANKDYPSAYTALLQATASGLSGQPKTDFQSRLEQYAVTSDLTTALKALNDAGYDTNKLTGGADKIGTKIGQLTTDPKYAAAANQLNLAYQNYRHQMTGAAFSAAEAAQYASVLPSAGNSFALNSAKIEGLNNFLTSSVDGYTGQVVGPGAAEVRKYAQGATPSTSDQYAQYRSQVPTGEILINRGGQIGHIPASELLPTDTKL